MTEKPPRLIILDSRARPAGPRLWVCALDTRQVKPNPTGALLPGMPGHPWKRVGHGGHGESCRDLGEVPWHEDTGMQPAGREGAWMTKRELQEKQGEEELTVLDASKVEDALGRHYFQSGSVFQ